MHETLLIKTKSKSYPIYIGSDLLENAGLWREHIHGTQVLLVSNEVVAPLYAEKIRRALAFVQCDTFLLPDGEAHKDFEHWYAILDALVENKHHRDTTLVALGGGVVGDMTGFAAACYQRGVDFIQAPTSLLAQVDASIGGKTAINHPDGKNLIGAFHQPNAVLIDIETLATLPDREYRSGLAEIIKAALISDVNFFDWIEQNISGLLERQHEVIMHAVTVSCQIKSYIVSQDEKEKGVRALLNLGHTFAHGIESILGYGTWLHGEAVACGLVLAAQLSCRRGSLSENEVSRLINLLQKASLPTVLPNEVKYDRLMQMMKMDKKVSNNQLSFILLEGIGKAIICQTVSEKELAGLL